MRFLRFWDKFILKNHKGDPAKFFLDNLLVFQIKILDFRNIYIQLNGYAIELYINIKRIEYKERISQTY